MKILALLLALVSFSAFAQEVVVSSEEILSAASSISSEEYPTGTINCFLVNTGWSRAYSKCVIDIAGVTAVVSGPEVIIDAVAKVKVPNGPYYSFSGSFEIVGNGCGRSYAVITID